MTIDGTVSEILGYPAWFLINDARIPAKSAPTKAAAAGGNEARSTSSSRRVLATAPISAAVAASFHGLLNIIENPEHAAETEDQQAWVKIELGRCKQEKFRMFAGPHEGAGIIQEEVVESCAGKCEPVASGKLNAMWMKMLTHNIADFHEGCI